MASTIKVDNVQNQPGTNIIDKCGTTITIGASSDTVALAAGASQTGFGREGSVDWQTGSIKTGTFTAVTGEGYFVNTSGGVSTVNLPAGAAGSIVAVADYTRTFNSNNCTITPNGSEKIGGVDASATLSVDGQSATFVYVDGTEGWINVQETQTSVAGAIPYVTATVSGACNTLTTVCTNYKVAKFVGPGTFCVSAGGSAAPCSGTGSNLVDYMVVAAGGGAGGNSYHIQGGGGGGAGGFRESPGTASGCYTVSPLGAAPAVALPVSVQGYSIVVGGGGTAGGGVPSPSFPCGPGALSTKGNDSSFSTITSTGGGGGTQPSSAPAPYQAAQPGGSGGGGGGTNLPAGTGNTPSQTPAQGTNGGQGASGGQTLGGSGGGATGAGSQSPPQHPVGIPDATPSRGAGATTNISASPVLYSRGGSYSPYNPSGAATPTCAGGNNTGNAGDAIGAGPGPANPATPANYGGNAGGSGIVIIRYKFQN